MIKFEYFFVLLKCFYMDQQITLLSNFIGEALFSLYMKKKKEVQSNPAAYLRSESQVKNKI